MTWQRSHVCFFDLEGSICNLLCPSSEVGRDRKRIAWRREPWGYTSGCSLWLREFMVLFPTVGWLVGQLFSKTVVS